MIDITIMYLTLTLNSMPNVEMIKLGIRFIW